MNLVLRKQSDHLKSNRKEILMYSLFSSAAGALPLPVLDEWFASAARRKVVRSIAKNRSVDTNKDAIEMMADGASPPPAWNKLLRVGMLFKLALKQWRKFLIAVLAAQKIQEASKTFCILTCFDHYCAKHHVGLGLDSDSAKALRLTIEQAIKETPGGLSRSLFKKGLSGTAHAMLSGPKNLFSRFSKFLDQGGKETPEHLEVEVVDDKNPHATGDELHGFDKVASGLEHQFSPIDNAYLEALIAHFDKLHTSKNK